MPTINEVINRVDKNKPNTYDAQTKANWLCKVDGRVSTEVLGQEPPIQYKYPNDGDKELIVPFPYDSLYDYYLEAMIDYSNKEFGSYNNAMILYNEAAESYAKRHIRMNRPKSSNFKNVMG
jgi:hypothetical protein